MIKILGLLPLVVIASIPANTLQYLAIAQPHQENVIYQGRVANMFDDTIYNRKFCCNTQLYILQLTKEEAKQEIIFIYSGDILSPSNVTISVEKEGTPTPTVVAIINNTIVVQSNCPMDPNTSNYWSRVYMAVNDVSFSFRMNCDEGERHQGFEWGYLIIMFINSLIMIGVALYSRIWSMALPGDKALGVILKWYWLLLFTLLAIGILVLVFYLDVNNQGGNVFGYTTKVLGNMTAVVFGVITLNQIFFLFNKLTRKVWKFLRICDILSISVSLALVILIGTVPTLSQNFVMNDLLSVVISVGAIKVFKFLDLRGALICCFIVFAQENLAALIIHIKYGNISYNDMFGSNISSPLFMQVPNLSHSLYQKCSWLPVSEIILPGITIAYLRRYDFSRDTKLYFIIGNLLFIVSTILWVIICSLSVHSFPFALITYPSLFIPIMIIGYKRAELKILMNGRFYDEEFSNHQQKRRAQSAVTVGEDFNHIRVSTLRGLLIQRQDLQTSKTSDG